ncbi:type IV pilus modification PilV family protein [Acidovorax sp.]|uniref:type IV pilus modification PilV family protein n=1 Tax=Acidovorax sp. TaxID=1872122 RepID=UPI0040381FA3
MTRPLHSRMRGMSLLELLVAFSILALSLGVLYKAIGGSARNVADAERYQRAVLLGESLLSARDAVTADGWSEEGQSAGYAWSVRSAPLETEASRRNPGAPALHQVDIRIDWSGERDTARSFRLSTLRPQRKLPAAEGPR